MKRKLTAYIITAAVISGAVCGSIPPAYADGDVINIASREDWNALAKSCTLDTWSRGRTVNITGDIDFTGEYFEPIPTFGGTLNGNGHTLSGISVTRSGSYTGVFRYVQEGAAVRDLNVRADITPDGSKSSAGGVVGENSGNIERCAFDGTVKGENVIGGVAGENTDSGRIVSCSAAGIVSGENSVGGIVGKNSGFLSDCVNNAQVNTVYEEKKKNDTSLLDVDAGAIVESYREEQEENEEESILGHSDTGGVVGYTTGIVQGCTNNADIGYEHIGYNVGGIAGRQAGYILGCSNGGHVQGRKDVGGIVGQAEPYILLSVTEDDIDNIRAEFDKLHNMMSDMLADTDGLESDTVLRFSEISGYAKTAKDNMETLINQGADFIDDNLAEINAQSAIISNTMNNLSDTFATLEGGGTNLQNALDALASSLDGLSVDFPDISGDTEEISAALRNLSDAADKLRAAARRAANASDNLYDAFTVKNQSQVKNAVNELTEAISDIIATRQNIQTSLEAIEEQLKKPIIATDLGEVRANVTKIKEANAAVVEAEQSIHQSLKTIVDNTEIDFTALKNAASDMEDALEHLSGAMGDISDGLSNMRGAVENISADQINEDVHDTENEITDAKSGLTDSVNMLSYAADDITSATSSFKQILSDLSNGDKLEFVKLGDEFRTASRNVFDSLNGISDEVETLKSNMQDSIDKLQSTVSDKRSKITGDITAVDDQLAVIVDLMNGEIKNLENSGSVTDIFRDVSDEDIEGTKQGKIAECKNSGKIEADRNTGGVAGAMAIEYAKDPEDDIEKPTTLHFAYETKAVLQGCINEGKVIGKKDCAGGLVGLAEIGTVYKCENYGDAESTNGSFVGGIAGRSDSSVRKSYAKSTLTGKRYVGGIAGRASVLSGCCTIVTVTGDENIGAVCGYAENRDKLAQNLYVDSGTGAVDGVSYSGKAESIPFDELKCRGGIPLRFAGFTVTFIADDKVVGTQEVQYGEPTERISYPDIPPKDGCFGTWHKPEADTVTENIDVVCEYKPYITVLSSNEKDEGGRLAIALAEGNFTDKSELSVTERTDGEQDNEKVYDVTLTGTDIGSGDSVTLRLLNPNRDKVTVSRVTDGGEGELGVTYRGRYVVFELKGANNTIRVKYEKNVPAAAGIIVLLLLGAVLIGVVAFIKKKTKHKPDDADVGEAEETEETEEADEN